ncbi:rhodanese-like domain-containing protein [Bacillus sp. JJ664]
MEVIKYLVIGISIFLIIKQFFPVKGLRHISTIELKSELKDRNKQFIDVRTSGEYNANRIKEFKNIPLHQLSQKAEKELSKNREVVVICQSGMRSQKAGKMLKKMGFKKITNVKGGMNTWK